MIELPSNHGEYVYREPHKLRFYFVSSLSVDEIETVSSTQWLNSDDRQNSFKCFYKGFVFSIHMPYKATHRVSLGPYIILFCIWGTFSYTTHIICIRWPKGSPKDDFYTAGTCMNRPIEKIKLQGRWRLQVEITIGLRDIARPRHSSSG